MLSTNTNKKVKSSLAGEAISFFVRRIINRKDSSGRSIAAGGLCALLLIANSVFAQDPDTWTQKADFGDTARARAVAFSIGDKGYIGTGSSFDGSIHYYNDLWEYDTLTNSWAQKADFPGTARSGAVGFSIGNKGYIGTGDDTFAPYKSDFWEYDPSTNTWTQKANFGGGKRAFAVGFGIGSKGYIGTGGDGTVYKNDFWEYDPANDTWTQKANFGGTQRIHAVGLSIGNKGYIGTGMEIILKNDFWEYDPANDTWTQKANFAGTPRYAATGFSASNKGYVGTGFDVTNSYKKDIGEYNPVNNTWTQKADFAGAARGFASAFSIGSKGYLGTGVHTDTTAHFYNDIWEYTTECTGLTAYADLDGDNYGDITSSFFAADCIVPFGYVLDSSDCNDVISTIHPGATEICNGLDEDCDGTADNGVPFVIYYADTDGDNFGDALYPGDTLCNNPGAGFASNNDDCNDANANINPTIAEICNGIDEDCTGTADDGLPVVTYYADADGDTYGDSSDPGDAFCSDPGAGYSTNNDDCKDNDIAINPAATETCNGIDEDCTGTADDGLPFLTYYGDVDGDDYGNADNTVEFCTQPSGYVTDSTDCNDNNPNVNPGAPEIPGNSIDDDCDGDTDEITGIASIVNGEFVFSLYPNPVSDEFVVYLQFSNDVNSDVTVEVINLLGQVMFAKTSTLLKGKLQETIKLHDAANGIYLVRVMVNEQVYCRQIVYEK